MAKAGDGRARSELRRKSAVIQVRVAPGQRRLIEARARREGYGSAAEYLRERGLGDNSSGQQLTAKFVGYLGYVGGWLTAASHCLDQAGLVKEAEQVRRYSKRSAGMQRELIKDAGSAGKSDP
ncbi:plasmid mobilization protein [Qingshengfaniella alkalisoli]|uniref:Uncharacterized protein n=1 Tax=Qingshengfaniella alkalisoli TaxID=2599296 RepID=A0A5B8IZL6_9RHOB|nr:hypothetical protein [Qingshengfaniella alkalisoli]QDY70391.1 hypothetical protein FPZ52_11730 [Qingshengfaniella alkalisoli]